ncbi:helix-turn-helix transcriptional regulator [Bradyrhizobium sp. LB11.1]|uniref:helix-turn-helix domain-containing protein n=1 Tax=Bradyrhizobium sp. LB11.1 TaxID=3156326 RepID=UPI00339A6E35
MSQPLRATLIDRRVAANLRTQRQRAGMSQETLAAAVGTSFQQLQKYERGVNRISIGRLILACEALEISFSSLLTDTGDKSKALR